MLRSRSFTRFTRRVGLPHFGQSVLLVVSMTFLRSAVFAIFAIALSWDDSSGQASPASSLSRSIQEATRIGVSSGNSAVARCTRLKLTSATADGFDCRRAPLSGSRRTPLSRSAGEGATLTSSDSLFILPELPVISGQSPVPQSKLPSNLYRQSVKPYRNQQLTCTGPIQSRFRPSPIVGKVRSQQSATCQPESPAISRSVPAAACGSPYVTRCQNRRMYRPARASAGALA